MMFRDAKELEPYFDAVREARIELAVAEGKRDAAQGHVNIAADAVGEAERAMGDALEEHLQA